MLDLLVRQLFSLKSFSTWFTQCKAVTSNSFHFELLPDERTSVRKAISLTICTSMEQSCGPDIWTSNWFAEFTWVVEGFEYLATNLWVSLCSFLTLQPGHICSFAPVLYYARDTHPGSRNMLKNPHNNFPTIIIPKWVTMFDVVLLPSILAQLDKRDISLSSKHLFINMIHLRGI